MSAGASSSADAGVEAAELEALLLQTLEPTTVHAAERALRRALKAPACVQPLAARAAHAADVRVRQVAAVLLRRAARTHWERLEAAPREAVKAAVLARLGAEPEGAVVRALAAVASEIGAAELPRAGWPELLGFLSDAAQAAAPFAREVAMLVLTELFEQPHGWRWFAPHLPQLSGVLRGCLADAHGPTRVATLRAVGALATGLLQAEDEAGAAASAALRELIPVALDVSRQCAAALGGAGGGGAEAEQLERSLSTALEMTTEVLESGQGALVRENVERISGLCLALAAAPECPASVRVVAFHALCTLCARRRKLVGRSAALLEALANLAAQAAAADEEEDEAEEEEEEGGGEGDDDDDEDDEYASRHKLGCQLLDTLACSVETKLIMPHVDRLLGASLAAAASDARAARAACLIVGMVAEGCAAPIGRRPARLAQFVAPLLAGCAHADVRVREAAALGIGELARHVDASKLLPAHLQHMARALCAVIDAASASAAAARGKAGARALDRCCYALEALCDAAAEDGNAHVRLLGDVAPELLGRLLTLAQQPRASAAARAAAVSSVASLVGSAPGALAPEQHAHALRCLGALMGETRAALLPLRARATECVGLCARALGADGFRPLLPDACAAAARGLGLGSHDVREYTFTLGAHLAALYAEQLDAGFVRALVPHLLASARADEIVERGGGGDDGDDDGAEGEADLEDEAEEEDEEEAAKRAYGLHSGVLDEKAAAAFCVGALARHCAAQLGHAHCMELLTALQGAPPAAAGGVAVSGEAEDEDDGACCDHFHEHVRHAAARALPALCAAAVGTAPDAAARAAAEGAVRRVSVPKLVSLLDDEDADVMVASARALVALGKRLGADVYREQGGGGAPALERVVAALDGMLRGVAPCQALGAALGGALAKPGGGGGADDEDEEGEGEGCEDAVWEAAAALLKGLGALLGDAWAPAFERLLPLLLARAASSLPVHEQGMAIGVLAEAVEQLPAERARAHAPTLLPLALRGATHALAAAAGEDEDEDDGADDAAQLVQNSVYLAGVLAAHGGDAVVAQLQPLLLALRHMLQRDAAPAVPPRLTDNALGALARVLRGSAALLPLEQIVPVMVGALPIREDFRENDVTLRTLMALFADAGTGAALAPFREAFVGALRGVVHTADEAAAAAAALPKPAWDDGEDEDEDEEQREHLTHQLRADVLAFLGGAA